MKEIRYRIVDLPSVGAYRKINSQIKYPSYDQVRYKVIPLVTTTIYEQVVEAFDETASE